MVMPVQGPQQVDVQAMGVTMVLDPLQMVLNGFHKGRHVGSCGKGRPKEEAGGDKRRNALPGPTPSLEHALDHTDNPHPIRPDRRNVIGRSRISGEYGQIA